MGGLAAMQLVRNLCEPLSNRVAGLHGGTHQTLFGCRALLCPSMAPLQHALQCIYVVLLAGCRRRSMMRRRHVRRPPARRQPTWRLCGRRQQLPSSACRRHRCGLCITEGQHTAIEPLCSPWLLLQFGVSGRVRPPCDLTPALRSCCCSLVLLGRTTASGWRASCGTTRPAPMLC